MVQALHINQLENNSNKHMGRNKKYNWEQAQ
jgi:hypothetical protein